MEKEIENKMEKEEKKMKQLEEKKINILKWKISSDEVLIAYTATWCNPCTRIKPHLLEYMKDKELISSEEIPKSDKPSHIKFIPHFDIFTYGANEMHPDLPPLMKSLQSSNENELLSFISQ